MPNWQDHPPQDSDHFTFRIVRTPPAATLIGILTCQKAIGCPTHFINHRTIPCDGEARCDPCADGHSWRWHGWASILITPSLEHAVFEFTAPTSETLKSYALQHETLRGCGLVAKRPSGHANGRVILKTTPVDQVKWRLPDPPNLQKILCHIWGVQYLPTPPGPSSHQPIAGLDIARSKKTNTPSGNNR